eukprot:Gb_33798 [translate_table: standard]
MIRPADAYNSLDHHTLSLTNLDLASRPAHVKPLYAFQSPTPPTSVLEGGLAKVLTIFREWAGRFTKDENGRPAIHLNDEGVLLIEARANGVLANAMPFDHSPFLTQLVPPTQGVNELLLVQLTRFSCGGLVIGIASHHQIADAEAFIFFMNSWGKVVRGQEPLNPLPLRDRSLLIPRDPPQPMFDHIEYKKRPPVPETQALSAGADADFLQVHHKNSASVGRLSPSIFLSPNVNVTSWVQLPMYELDFGWGTPVYAGPSLMPIEGRLTFIPSYIRDRSIDVMVCLLEADMAKLEQICYKV